MEINSTTVMIKITTIISIPSFHRLRGPPRGRASVNRCSAQSFIRFLAVKYGISALVSNSTAQYTRRRSADHYFPLAAPGPE
jgi:hypothetical protein